MTIHNSKVDNFIKVLSFKSCGQGAGRTTGGDVSNCICSHYGGVKVLGSHQPLSCFTSPFAEGPSHWYYLAFSCAPWGELLTASPALDSCQRRKNSEFSPVCRVEIHLQPVGSLHEVQNCASSLSSNGAATLLVLDAWIAIFNIFAIAKIIIGTSKKSAQQLVPHVCSSVSYVVLIVSLLFFLILRLQVVAEILPYTQVIQRIQIFGPNLIIN